MILATIDAGVVLPIAAVCGVLALSMAQRNFRLKGVYPWKLHPAWWFLIGFLIGLVGVALCGIARATTKVGASSNALDAYPTYPVTGGMPSGQYPPPPQAEFPGAYPTTSAYPPPGSNPPPGSTPPGRLPSGRFLFGPVVLTRTPPAGGVAARSDAPPRAALLGRGPVDRTRVRLGHAVDRLSVGLAQTQRTTRPSPSPSAATSTVTVSPSVYVPSSRASARRSSIERCSTRRRGRAPRSGS